MPYIQNLFILEALATMAFSRSSADIKLEGSYLKARCKDRAGSFHDSAVELNNYIANIDGLLKWQPNGNFVASSRNVILAGAVLKCQSKTRKGAWRDTSINLDEKISNYNGKLIYKFEHAIIKVDKKNEKEVISYIDDIYKEHKASVHVQAADMQGGSKVSMFAYTSIGFRTLYPTLILLNLSLQGYIFIYLSIYVCAEESIKIKQ